MRREFYTEFTLMVIYTDEHVMKIYIDRIYIYIDKSDKNNDNNKSDGSLH